MHKPLISCVMPTRGRSSFIPLAVHYFKMQDYPNKELIIVYDTPEDLPKDFAPGENIKLVRSNGVSTGAKRNEGCKHALGPIIAQWDDDDIYHPERLSRQAAPIIDGTADITGLQDTLFFEHDTGKCWSCHPAIYATMFLQHVAGGTLTFRRMIWEKYPYQPVSMREDAEFLHNAVKRGLRLKKINGRGLFIYRRHSRNTWKFNAGQLLNPDGWKEEILPEWACSRTDETAADFVSCIMPTADREKFIGRSIACFLEQDFPNKELIIIDDGTKPVASLVPFHPMVRYIRQDTKMNIGQKRNEACRISRGNIIMHWDDDDWYAKDWISHQVQCMKTTEADICGLDHVLFYDQGSYKAWIYEYPAHAKHWVAGATLAYRKTLWEKQPFENIQIGEDNFFVWKTGGKVVPHKYLDGFISFIHPGNTSPKHVHTERWKTIPADRISQILNS